MLPGRELGLHQIHSQSLRRCPNALGVRELPLLEFLARQVGDTGYTREHLSQEPQTLGLDLRTDLVREPRDVAAGSCEALNDTAAHGIDTPCHDDGEGRGDRLCCL